MPPLKQPSEAGVMPSSAALSAASGSSAISGRRMRQRSGSVFSSDPTRRQPVRTISPLWKRRLFVRPSRKSR